MTEAGANVEIGESPEVVGIAGPPRASRPQNVATPVELPLDSHPSNDWKALFERFDWHGRFNMRVRPVLDGDRIRVEWLGDETRSLLTAVATGISEINGMLTEQRAREAREIRERQEREESEARARQALLDGWWDEYQGGS